MSNSFPTLAVSSHPPLPPWTSNDILCSESLWETDPGSNEQHWCRLAGERNRRWYWSTLHALGWDESYFLKCLFPLTREWPKDGANIHLLDLSSGEMGTLPPLRDLVGVWAKLFRGLAPSWSHLLNEPWAMQKSATSVSAAMHDLNNTNKTMPNMYWNQLSQKMQNLVMWSAESSCQLSPTPLKIRHHMPQKWGTSTQLSFLNRLAYGPTSTHFRMTNPAKIM